MASGAPGKDNGGAPRRPRHKAPVLALASLEPARPATPARGGTYIRDGLRVKYGTVRYGTVLYGHTTRDARQPSPWARRGGMAAVLD